MTAAGLHHLPSDDGAPVRLVLEALAKLGVTPTEGQRHTLAVAHEYGWLTGPDGIARILADASPAARAAVARQRVRGLRAEASAKAKFHASQQHPRQTRAWSFLDGGFRCHLCGLDFLRYVDPAGAASAAQDHTQQCTGGGTDA